MIAASQSLLAMTENWVS